MGKKQTKNVQVNAKWRCMICNNTIYVEISALHNKRTNFSIFTEACDLEHGACQH